MTIIPARLAPYTLAAFRVIGGLLFLAHGLVKLTGFPAGASPGLQPLFSTLGAGGVIETVAGTLIVLGLFTGPAAFLASGEMAFAYFLFHAPQSFFPAINGGDAAILLSFLFLHIAAVGPGAFALDNRRAAGLKVAHA